MSLCNRQELRDSVNWKYFSFEVEQKRNDATCFGEQLCSEQWGALQAYKEFD